MTTTITDISSARLQIIERSIECMERRINGESTASIAADMGLTVKQVNGYLIRGLKASLTPTQEAIRGLEMMRLEEIGRVCMDAVRTAQSEGKPPPTRVLEMYLRAADQRAKLTGLYNMDAMENALDSRSRRGRQVVDAPAILDVIRGDGTSSTGDGTTSGADGAPSPPAENLG